MRRGFRYMIRHETQDQRDGRTWKWGGRSVFSQILQCSKSFNEIANGGGEMEILNISDTVPRERL